MILVHLLWIYDGRWCGCGVCGWDNNEDARIHWMRPEIESLQFSATRKWICDGNSTDSGHFPIAIRWIIIMWPSTQSGRHDRHICRVQSERQSREQIKKKWSDVPLDRERRVQQIAMKTLKDLLMTLCMHDNGFSIQQCNATYEWICEWIRGSTTEPNNK